MIIADRMDMLNKDECGMRVLREGSSISRCTLGVMEGSSGKRPLGSRRKKRIPRIQLSLAFQSPKLHGVVPLKSTFGIQFMLFDKSLLRILHHLLVTVIASEIRATTSQKRTS